MDTTRSELTKALVRAGLRVESAGTEASQGMKVPGAATNRAHRQLPATGREELSPVHVGGMREAHAYLDEFEAAEAEAPAGVRGSTQFEPSPARQSGQVLRLVHTSSRRRPTRYVEGPRLTLTNGGKV